MDGKQVEHWLVLDDDEHEAMGDLLEFMWKLRKWGMTANQVEMEARPSTCSRGLLFSTCFIASSPADGRRGHARRSPDV